MKRLLYVLIALAAIVVLVVVLFRPDDSFRREPLNTVLSDARAGASERIEVYGGSLTVRRSDGAVYEARKDRNAKITDILAEAGVAPAQIERIEVSVREPGLVWQALQLLLNFLPIILGAGLVIWAVRRGRSP